MLGVLPGTSLLMQIVRLLVTIGASLAALAGVAQVLRIPGVRRSARPGAEAHQEDRALKERGWLGLHPSIWKVASTHVVVDAYTNIYAPMLPLLIPHLNLSLTTAGTLAMCFQMANSVSQLGFGALADRWRPQLLVIAGPLVAVIVLSLIGLAGTPFMLGVILVLGGLGGAAFHPPAAALVYKLADHRKGLAMSAHLSGGSLGFAFAPLLFAPFIAYVGLRYSPLIMIPGPARVVVDAAAGAADPAAGNARAVDLDDAAPGGGAADAALLHHRAAHRDDLRLHDVHADAADAPGLQHRRGERRGVALPVRERRRRISSADRWPTASGARRVIVWSLIAAVPFMAVAPHLPPLGFTAMLAIGGLLLQSTLPISVTFAQSFVTGGAATVSSLMMGFAWGMGSLTVPLIGMGADRYGIEPTLAVVAFIPLLAAALAWRLPGTGPPHVEPKRVDSASVAARSVLRSDSWHVIPPARRSRSARAASRPPSRS